MSSRAKRGDLAMAAPTPRLPRRFAPRNDERDVIASEARRSRDSGIDAEIAASLRASQ